MSLLNARTIAISIERPVAVVYDFLADPRNYPRWASVEGTYEQVGPLEWSAEMSFGTRFIAFSERNTYGVLDHSERAEGGEPIVNPMRALANGDGSELTLTFFQRPGMSDDAFLSAIEWITADLLALKSMLE